MTADAHAADGGDGPEEGPRVKALLAFFRGAKEWAEEQRP